MIRPEIKKIIDNIDKFETNIDYKYDYTCKKIKIDALWEKLSISGKSIKLSFWERRYLFKPFRKKTREENKHLKNYEKQKENKLLQSIVFSGGEK